MRWAGLILPLGYAGVDEMYAYSVNCSVEFLRNVSDLLRKAGYTVAEHSPRSDGVAATDRAILSASIEQRDGTQVLLIGANGWLPRCAEHAAAGHAHLTILCGFLFDFNIFRLGRSMLRIFRGERRPDVHMAQEIESLLLKLGQGEVVAAR